MGAPRGPVVARLIAIALVALAAHCSEEARPPVLQLDPALVTLVPGDSTGAFTVSNAGGGTLTWQLQTDAPWLRLDAREGSTTASQSTVFGIHRASLRQGPPRATIAVGSNGGDGQVGVRMWPALAVHPDTVDLRDTLRTASIRLMNTAADTVWWTASAAPEWLSVAPSGGTLVDAPESLEVRVRRADLAAGDYAGEVRIDAGAYGRDTVRVAMRVPPMGDVTGRVFFVGTRIPIPGVEVRVEEAVDTTDAGGAFTLRGVPLGDQRLEAHRAGFDDLLQPVRVSDSGTYLELAMATAAHVHDVTGRAVNRLGNGAGSVRVALLNPDDSESGIHALTAHDGTYTLSGVPEGTQRLRWSGYLYEARVSSLSVGPGAVHEVQLVARPLEPPYMPAGPTLRQIDCTSIRVGWSRRNEETVGGYRVERADYSGGDYRDVSGTVGAAETHFDDRTADGSGFRYRVRTENIDGAVGEPTPHHALTLGDWFLLNDGLVGPYERWGHAAVYDPRDHRMLIFGGIGCIGAECGKLFNDTWALDLSSYEWDTLDVGTGPAKRQDHHGIYDARRHRLVVFGGRDLAGAFDDTWALDIASLTWTRLEDGRAAPPARYGHAMVWDEAGDRMIVYGGEQTEALNDVWAFDLATNAWTRLRTGEYGELDPQPDARGFPGAVADPARRRLIVHGGVHAGTIVHRDTWALDLATATWTRLPDGPSPRFGPAGVYDSAHDRVLLYGGSQGDVHFDDLIALHLAAEPFWEEIGDGPAGAGPGVRFYQSAIEDPVRNGLIMFGGHMGTALDARTWAYCHTR
jgi:hypothetical protein